MEDFWTRILRRAAVKADELISSKNEKNKRFQKYQKRVRNRNKLYQRLRRLGRI